MESGVFTLCAVCLQDCRMAPALFKKLEAPVAHEPDCQTILCPVCRRIMAGADRKERLKLVAKAKELGRPDALAAILDFYKMEDTLDGRPAARPAKLSRSLVERGPATRPTQSTGRGRKRRTFIRPGDDKAARR